MTQDTTIIEVFRHCVAAIRDGKLICRESRQDKEFHFQNWVRARLDETGLHHDVGGRNAYPDFRMVRFTEGYEEFDLRGNTIVPQTIPNPGAGREHEFTAWRVSTGSRDPVVLREPAQVASDAGGENGEETTEE